jgi:hypothetical protein
LQDAVLPRVPIRYLKRYHLRSLVDLLFGGPGKFLHTLFLYDIIARVANEVARIFAELAAEREVDTYGPADLIDAGCRSRDTFGLWQALRPVVRAGLRVADGLGQHLA